MLSELQVTHFVLGWGFFDYLEKTLREIELERRTESQALLLIQFCGLSSIKKKLIKKMTARIT